MRRFLLLILLLIPLQGFSQWVHFPVEYLKFTPRQDTLTFYVRHGDYLARIAVGLAAAALLFFIILIPPYDTQTVPSAI